MEIQAEKFPDLLESLNISSQTIKDQILHCPLHFDSYKNENVEWGMKLPMFVESFYPYILENKAIPTQGIFWEYYKKTNDIDSLITSNELQRGVKARLFRTYPSLVRDIHFSMYLKEKSINSTIIYNLELDVKYGIDILVVFQNKLFSINLFTPTKRAYIGRGKKKNRHLTISNVTDIELPVEFNNSHKHGNFYLYGDSEIVELRNQFKILLH